MATQEYTIDIPGAADIIRLPIPELENEQLKAERIARMISAKSPIPGSLDWIPPLINKLDDAQDILFTGLVLAKPLLRRLPARLIPGLGAVLTINDVVNMITGVLSLPLTGPTGKRGFINSLDALAMNRPGMLRRAADFLSKRQWLPFMLQAPQALESLTGYGVVLGSIMGMVSDSVWGAIRAMGGASVTIRTPPPSDPVMKAYRYLAQGSPEMVVPDALSPHDHDLIRGASCIAMQMVEGTDIHTKMDQRMSMLADTEMPVWLPTNQSSVNALNNAGIHFGPAATPADVAGIPSRRTIDAVQNVASKLHDYRLHLDENIYMPRPNNQISQLMFEEFGDDFWRVQGQTQRPYRRAFFPWESALIQLARGGITTVERTDLKKYQMLSVLAYAQKRALMYPNEEPLYHICDVLQSWGVSLAPQKLIPWQRTPRKKGWSSTPNYKWYQWLGDWDPFGQIVHSNPTTEVTYQNWQWYFIHRNSGRIYWPPQLTGSLPGSPETWAFKVRIDPSFWQQ